MKGRDPLDGAFAALRHDEQQHTPPFRVNRPAPRRSRPTALALGLIAVLVTAVGWPSLRALRLQRDVRRAAHMAESLGAFAGTQWRAPTDTLLATPGIAVWRRVPEVGLARTTEPPQTTGALP